MIDSFLASVFKPIGNWIGNRVLKRLNSEVVQETIADRFTRLFASHGVSQSQIPRLIEVLSISDVSSSESLIEVLNGDIICQACELFGVEREWLEGAQTETYQSLSFYKNIRGLNAFLDAQEITSERWGSLFAVKVKGTDIRAPEKSHCGVEIVLVLRKLIKQLSSEQLVQKYFPVIDGASWGYLGSQMYLRAVFRLASDRSLMCRGVEVSRSDFEFLKSRKVVPEEIIESAVGSWDIYGLAMTDEEIQESTYSTGGDWLDLIQHGGSN